MIKEFYKHFDLSKVLLTPRNVLGLRDAEYIEALFFEHEIYTSIKQSILNSPISFIIGHPLSGKTRIVYDVLKLSKTWNLVIPKKDKHIEEYILPNNLINMVVLLDDVDEYCYSDNNSLNKLLKYIVYNNIKCIITCRKGPELDKFKKHLHPNIYFKVSQNKFDIPRFNKNDLNVMNFLTLNEHKFKSAIKNFDGNFGSIVLPLDAMRERFQKLLEKEKDTAISILLGLKLHFHFFNFEDIKSKYSDIKIKKFSEKYLNNKLSMYEWDDAKNELISNETALNFIDSPSDIVIEEAYLDFLFDINGNICDVVHSDFTYKRLSSLLEKLYTIEEKKVWGFPTNIWDYNKAIEKSKNYDEAITIYNGLPRQIEPDACTFSTIMKKTKDINILKKLWQEIVNRKFKIEFATRDSFTGQFDSFEDLLNALYELNIKLFYSRNGGSDKLLKLASISPKESLKTLFSKFAIEEIYANPVLNEICRQCCQDDEDYKKYVEPFIERVQNLDYPLLLNFIKICVRVNKPIGLELLDKYCDKSTFDYLNEKGNCIVETAPFEALNLFLDAEKKAKNEIERTIAKCNFCNLVYDKEIVEKLDEAIILSDIFIEPKLNVRPAKYLREVFILLNIWRTSLDNLATSIVSLLNRPDINKHTFQQIIAKIKDDRKKKIIKDLFSPDESCDKLQPT